MPRTPADADWAAIEHACRNTPAPLRSIAAAHHVALTTLHRRLHAGGWRQGAGALPAPPPAAPTPTAAPPAIPADADAACGLRIHRACLRALEAAATQAADPRDIKLIIDATRAAVASLRSLSGEDEPAPAEEDDDGYAHTLARRLEATQPGAASA